MRSQSVTSTSDLSDLSKAEERGNVAEGHFPLGGFPHPRLW